MRIIWLSCVHVLSIYQLSCFSPLVTFLFFFFFPQFANIKYSMPLWNPCRAQLCEVQEQRKKKDKEVWYMLNVTTYIHTEIERKRGREIRTHTLYLSHLSLPPPHFIYKFSSVCMQRCSKWAGKFLESFSFLARFWDRMCLILSLLILSLSVPC